MLRGPVKKRETQHCQEKNASNNFREKNHASKGYKDNIKVKKVLFVVCTLELLKAQALTKYNTKLVAKCSGRAIQCTNMSKRQ